MAGAEAQQLIWENTHLTSLIIPLLPIADLESYTLVSKKWRHNEKLYWKHKYLETAILNMQNAGDSFPFKKLYFQRFHLDELLVILYEKYKSSQDIAYMQQVEVQARSAAIINAFKCKSRQDASLITLISQMLCVGNFIERRARYEQGEDGESYSNIVNFTGMLYSPTSLKRIPISIELAEQKSMDGYCRLLQMVVLHEDQETAQHLGYCDWPDGKPVIVPDETACSKLFKFLEVDVDYKGFLDSMEDLAQAALEYADISIKHNSIEELMNDHSNNLQHKISTSTTKYSIQSSAKKSSTEIQRNYYATLMGMAKGEIQQKDALKFARDNGLKQNIIRLLENTTIISYSQKTGRYYPLLFEQETNCTWGIFDSNFCELVLHTPENDIKISAMHQVTAGGYEYDDVWESQFRVSANSDIQLINLYNSSKKLTIPIGDDTIDDDDLQGLLPSINVNKNSVDFLVYVVLCLNIIEYLYVSENSAQEIWSVQSTNDLAKHSKARCIRLAEVVKKARLLKEEIKWDGRPHPSFDAWDWGGAENSFLQDEKLQKSDQHDSDESEIDERENGEDEEDEKPAKKDRKAVAAKEAEEGQEEEEKPRRGKKKAKEDNEEEEAPKIYARATKGKGTAKAANAAKVKGKRKGDDEEEKETSEKRKSARIANRTTGKKARKG